MAGKQAIATSKEVEERVDLKCLLEDKMKALGPRERQVIILIFGLNGEKQRSEEEISAELFLKEKSVFQIKYNALKKLRHPARTKDLKDFL